MRVLAGLGNPGPRFRGTRHNAGYLVLDALAERWGASFRRGRNADEARARELHMIKPRTFMNLSGRAVQTALSRTGSPPRELLVVHDDLDLPLGRLRLRVGGGAGGQRGVRDIIERLGPEFARLKVGISRPPEGWTAERWVLSRFAEDERELLQAVVSAAADAIELVLERGIELAMSQVNGVELAPDPGRHPT